MNHPTRFAGLLAAVFALVPVFAAAAGPTIADNKEPIVLPGLKVTATAELEAPETWRYARVGQFDVLSNATDRYTRNLLADFAKFTQAIALVWPAPPKPLAAATIIFCGKEAKFDGFAPAGAVKDDAIVPSVFLRNREQVAIVVDIEADRIMIDPTKVDVANAGSAEYEVNHYKQLYREYVRFLLSQSSARVPVWLEEGLAQIIMDIELDDERLIYGKVNSYGGAVSGGESADSDGTDPTANTGAVVGEQPFNVALAHRKLIPLGEFFAITADDPAAQSPLGNNFWAKQAYLFVHFCMFGEDLRHQQALSTFVSRLAREPLSEALFKECFKTDYKGMNNQLWSYLLRTKHKYQRYDLKKGDQLTAKSIELRDATPVEVAVIKGDALRLGGHLDTALAAYRAAYLRGQKDPLVLAGMGIAESALSHPDRAVELLEPAVKAGIKRPSAYVELARLRLAAAGSARLSAAQLSSVLSPLFEARKLQLPLPETYEVIAEAWSRSSVGPTADNLAVLDEGIRAFPRDSGLLLSAAELYNQAGSPPTAASIAKLGLRFSSDAETKAKFEQLLSKLPPVPAKK